MAATTHGRVKRQRAPNGTKISEAMTKMLTKISPALTGLPTLISALTAKARPLSVGSSPQSLGNKNHVTRAQTAKPVADRKKNDWKSRNGPQRWPRLESIQLSIRSLGSRIDGKGELGASRRVALATHKRE